MNGGSTITNEPELLGFATGTGVDRDLLQVQRREQAQAHAILSARPGRRVLTLIGAGAVRLLVVPVGSRYRAIATVEIGEPWGAVARAQESVRHAFLLVGVLALLAASGAAHLVASWIWLRTPLTVISGQSELLSLPGLSADDAPRITQLVQVEIARMNRLIEDMLLLATSDRGSYIQKRRFDVNISERSLPRSAGIADRRFELSASATGSLDGDADRIAQAIRNLTRNAIEHTGRGGLVRLTARARSERLELAVEDDGPGIPEEERASIFDRFHRTDGSRSRSLGGSGLGLAIARAIVLAHGGRIWVDDSPEGGARVALELPLFVGLRPGGADPRRRDGM